MRGEPSAPTEASQLAATVAPDGGEPKTRHSIVHRRRHNPGWQRFAGIEYARGDNLHAAFAQDMPFSPDAGKRPSRPSGPPRYLTQEKRRPISFLD